MFGSHYSSFLWFLFKRSAPEIEPQSPISITCPIIQLGLFYSMKTPPELVTGFQLSHLQLSSLLWRFVLGEGIVLDGNWEENHSWGSSSSALEAKKWDVHRNPFSSWKCGCVYSQQEIGKVCSCSSPLPGFELWLGHCPSGGTPVVPGAPSCLDCGHPVPGVFPPWDFRICPKARIFWVPQKPEGPLGRACGAEQRRLCHPSNGNGNGSLGMLRLELQQELGMPPSRSCSVVSCWVWDPEPPGCF